MKQEVVEAAFRTISVSLTVLFDDVVADIQDNGPYMKLEVVGSLNTFFTAVFVDGVVIFTIEDPFFLNGGDCSTHTSRYEADMYTTFADLVRSAKYMDMLNSSAA